MHVHSNSTLYWDAGLLSKYNYCQRSTFTGWLSAQNNRRTSFHSHTCRFLQYRILWTLPPKKVSKASLEEITTLWTGLCTSWGMVHTALLQKHRSFRSAVPSSVSPSHPQVVLVFKSYKELSRAAVPSCGPPMRGGNTIANSRQGWHLLSDSRF